MNTIVVQVENEEKMVALKAFLKALSMKFSVSKDGDYQEEFVKKIEQGDKDIASGNTTKISLDDIWK